MKTILSPILKTTLLSFLLISCEQADLTGQDCILPTDKAQGSEEIITEETEAVAKTEIAKPIDCIIPDKALTGQMEINATLNDFNDGQTQKMNNALERLKIILNSQSFKQRILDHEYNGKKIFANNDGLTNLEVYEKIMLGSEELNPGDDSEVDIQITLYYANNGTVGYTYPSVNKIWVNNKFFAGYNLARVAANVVHEWSHKLGFGHDFKRTARRNFSVPYAVGTIVKELIEEMSVLPPPTHTQVQ